MNKKCKKCECVITTYEYLVNDNLCHKCVIHGN